jgi:hypothetical protein
MKRLVLLLAMLVGTLTYAQGYDSSNKKDDKSSDDYHRMHALAWSRYSPDVRFNGMGGGLALEVVDHSFVGAEFMVSNNRRKDVMFLNYSYEISNVILSAKIGMGDSGNGINKGVWGYSAAVKVWKPLYLTNSWDRISKLSVGALVKF